MAKIKVVIYGCGVMGRKVVEALLDKTSIEVVGAVDIDPEIAGKDLGEILDHPIRIGVTIEEDADTLFSRVNSDAVILTTTSHLKSIEPQIVQCINAGLNVVSTCEELSYPWKRSPDLADKIDKMAKEAGVTIVGTGINPGYLMDFLPLTLTSPCLRVDSVRVTRMMNSGRRRIPFQKKIGTGMMPVEFRQKINDKVITGHVGLLESINMIAAGLSWELDKTVELPSEAVITEKPIETGLGLVEPGNVIGLKSIAYGEMGGEKVITLEFFAFVGVEEEYDEVIIEGLPRIHERVIGGVHGDVGTVAMTINTVLRAVQAAPGIKLMKDLPAASCVS